VMNSPQNMNLSRYDSINSFTSSYAVIGSQRVIHEKDLGRLFVNKTAVADAALLNRVSRSLLPSLTSLQFPGSQKTEWIRILAHERNESIVCLDKERNHKGKFLPIPPHLIGNKL
jgi:hypothetical protein